MTPKNRLRNLSFLWLPILAGILIGTSYIPFPPWALFFCLSPLFIFWSRVECGRRAFWGGWVTQFLLNLIGFHWIAYTAVEFGHFPIWGGVLSLIGFCAIAHMHYPLAGWISFHLSCRLGLPLGARFFAMALVFALCETVVPMIFPWHLGYPWLYAGLPGAQVADVIGFEGLNVITILVNALLAWTWVSWREGARRSATISALVAALLVLIPNIAGIGRAEPWRKTDSEISILTVQGNIGNFDKLIAEKGSGFRAPIIQKFIRMSLEGLAKNPDANFVIWPETAFPSVLDKRYLSEPHAQTVLDFVRTAQTPLLTGSYSSDGNETYNAFFYVGLDPAEQPPPYRKSILLVFGETFPLSDYIPYMNKIFPDLGAFGRGSGPMVMHAPIRRTSKKLAQSDGALQAGLIAATANDVVRLGPQICYEGLYPEFSMALSREGAQIFANVTNDSWFGSNFEPYQHMYMTFARAIEFRRPLIRSTNTGITTAILASGDMLERSPMHTEWTGNFRIPYLADPPHTFFEKIANRWSWILAISLLLLLGFTRERRKKPQLS
jgi:apolipoprotein N-acyltransferase